MLAELLVIGTSGLAKEAAQLARDIDPEGRRWSRISYVSERRETERPKLPFGELRYADEDLPGLSGPFDVVIGIGLPEVRRRVSERLGKCPQCRFPNLVHPTAALDASHVRIGRGNAICRGVVFTCDIEVADFSWLNINVVVGHDARIGSHCVINPSVNVSGRVHVGDACLIGTGSQILEGLSIHPGSTLGAGAVLTRSTESAGVYVGTPARRLK